MTQLKETNLRFVQPKRALPFRLSSRSRSIERDTVPRVVCRVLPHHHQIKRISKRVFDVDRARAGQLLRTIRGKRE